MISKVEKGLVNDDFLKDRITVKAYQDIGDPIYCKLYDDGRLVKFTGGWGDENFPYEEEEIFWGLEDEIKAKLMLLI